jgi:DNA-binding Lrp family transcriptional regulator
VTTTKTQFLFRLVGNLVIFETIPLNNHPQSTYAMNKITRTDYQLLDALQRDATLSQIDLAELTGMSRTSVWRRIRELEEAGLIEGKVALLNPRALGLQIHVLLSVSMVEHSDRTRRDFEAYVQTLPEVMECFSISGDRDYLLQIISRDMESYNDFLNSQILHHPSVHSASSSFALRRVKYTTALPV